MTPTIKPGTRCECRGCEAHFTRHEHAACDMSAVRMVTVRENPFETSLHHGLSTPDVPMCEPCATYHESKAVTR